MPISSDSSLSRRERERRMRRQAMLDAASAVFAEKGYTQATLDEIADRAEFGKGTLYNYFEDGKEGLLFAIFDQVYDDLEDMIRTTVGSDGRDDHAFRAAFHDLVVRSFGYYENREDLFLILIKEAHRLCFSDDAEKAAYFQAQQQRMVDAFVPAVEAAMGTNRIATLPSTPVAYMLLEVIHDLIVHRCLTERNEDPDEACLPDADLMNDPDAAADFLTSLLFDGLHATGSPNSSE
ncbi:MAG: TetR/AcrR family transcriptional regulator [Bacteroidetes bacterium SW_9_63_38]|nr:MAG: TetR/AcrR family transcriptional regulator [Bacteroidetes bacterium SW_9_63_38]